MMNNKIKFDLQKYLDGLLEAKTYDRFIFEQRKNPDNPKSINSVDDISLINEYLTSDDVLDIIKYIEEQTNKCDFLRSSELDEPFICTNTNVNIVANALEEAMKNNDEYNISIPFCIGSHFYPLCVKKQGNQIIFITSEASETYMRLYDKFIESFKNQYGSKYEINRFSVDKQARNSTVSKATNICAIECIRKAYEIQQQSFEYYKESLSNDNKQHDILDLNIDIDIQKNLNKTKSDFMKYFTTLDDDIVMLNLRSLSDKMLDEDGNVVNRFVRVNLMDEDKRKYFKHDKNGKDLWDRKNKVIIPDFKNQMTNNSDKYHQNKLEKQLLKRQNSKFYEKLISRSIYEEGVTNATENIISQNTINEINKKVDFKLSLNGNFYKSTDGRYISIGNITDTFIDESGITCDRYETYTIGKDGSKNMDGKIIPGHFIYDRYENAYIQDKNRYDKKFELIKQGNTLIKKFPSGVELVYSFDEKTGQVTGKNYIIKQNRIKTIDNPIKIGDCDYYSTGLITSEPYERSKLIFYRTNIDAYEKFTREEFNIIHETNVNNFKKKITILDKKNNIEIAEITNNINNKQHIKFTSDIIYEGENLNTYNREDEIENLDPIFKKAIFDKNKNLREDLIIREEEPILDKNKKSVIGVITREIKTDPRNNNRNIVREIRKTLCGNNFLNIEVFEKIVYKKFKDEEDCYEKIGYQADRANEFLDTKNKPDVTVERTNIDKNRKNKITIENKNDKYLVMNFKTYEFQNDLKEFLLQDDDITINSDYDIYLKLEKDKYIKKLLDEYGNISNIPNSFFIKNKLINLDKEKLRLSGDSIKKEDVVKFLEKNIDFKKSQSVVDIYNDLNKEIKEKNFKIADKTSFVDVDSKDNISLATSDGKLSNNLYQEILGYNINLADNNLTAKEALIPILQNDYDVKNIDGFIGSYENYKAEKDAQFARDTLISLVSGGLGYGFGRLFNNYIKDYLLEDLLKLEYKKTINQAPTLKNNTNVGTYKINANLNNNLEQIDVDGFSKLKSNISYKLNFNKEDISELNNYFDTYNVDIRDKLQYAEFINNINLPDCYNNVSYDDLNKVKACIDDLRNTIGSDFNMDKCKIDVSENSYIISYQNSSGIYEQFNSISNISQTNMSLGDLKKSFSKLGDIKYVDLQKKMELFQTLPDSLKELDFQDAIDVKLYLEEKGITNFDNIKVNIIDDGNGAIKYNIIDIEKNEIIETIESFDSVTSLVSLSKSKPESSQVGLYKMLIGSNISEKDFRNLINNINEVTAYIGNSSSGYENNNSIIYNTNYKILKDFIYSDQNYNISSYPFGKSIKNLNLSQLEDISNYDSCYDIVRVSEAEAIKDAFKHDNLKVNNIDVIAGDKQEFTEEAFMQARKQDPEFNTFCKENNVYSGDNIYKVSFTNENGEIKNRFFAFPQYTPKSPYVLEAKAAAKTVLGNDNRDQKLAILKNLCQNNNTNIFSNDGSFEHRAKSMLDTYKSISTMDAEQINQIKNIPNYFNDIPINDVDNIRQFVKGDIKNIKIINGSKDEILFEYSSTNYIPNDNYYLKDNIILNDSEELTINYLKQNNTLCVTKGLDAENINTMHDIFNNVEYDNVEQLKEKLDSLGYTEKDYDNLLINKTKVNGKIIYRIESRTPSNVKITTEDPVKQQITLIDEDQFYINEGNGKLDEQFINDSLKLYKENYNITEEEMKSLEDEIHKTRMEIEQERNSINEEFNSVKNKQLEINEKYNKIYEKELELNERERELLEKEKKGFLTDSQIIEEQAKIDKDREIFLQSELEKVQKDLDDLANDISNMEKRIRDYNSNVENFSNKLDNLNSVPFVKNEIEQYNFDNNISKISDRIDVDFNKYTDPPKAQYLYNEELRLIEQYEKINELRNELETAPDVLKAELEKINDEIEKFNKDNSIAQENRLIYTEAQAAHNMIKTLILRNNPNATEADFTYENLSDAEKQIFDHTFRDGRVDKDEIFENMKIKDELEKKFVEFNNQRGERLKNIKDLKDTYNANKNAFDNKKDELLKLEQSYKESFNDLQEEKKQLIIKSEEYQPDPQPQPEPQPEPQPGPQVNPQDDLQLQSDQSINSNIGQISNQYIREQKAVLATLNAVENLLFEEIGSLVGGYLPGESERKKIRHKNEEILFKGFDKFSKEEIINNYNSRGVTNIVGLKGDLQLTKNESSSDDSFFGVKDDQIKDTSFGHMVKNEVKNYFKEFKFISSLISSGISSVTSALAPIPLIGAITGTIARILNEELHKKFGNDEFKKSLQLNIKNMLKSFMAQQIDTNFKSIKQEYDNMLLEEKEQKQRYFLEVTKPLNDKLLNCLFKAKMKFSTENRPYSDIEYYNADLMQNVFLNNECELQKNKNSKHPDYLNKHRLINNETHKMFLIPNDKTEERIRRQLKQLTFMEFIRDIFAKYIKDIEFDIRIDKGNVALYPNYSYNSYPIVFFDSNDTLYLHNNFHNLFNLNKNANYEKKKFSLFSSLPSLDSHKYSEYTKKEHILSLADNKVGHLEDNIKNGNMGIAAKNLETIMTNYIEQNFKEEKRFNTVLDVESYRKEMNNMNFSDIRDNFSKIYNDIIDRSNIIDNCFIKKKEKRKDFYIINSSRSKIEIQYKKHLFYKHNNNKEQYLNNIHFYLDDGSGKAKLNNININTNRKIINSEFKRNNIIYKLSIDCEGKYCIKYNSKKAEIVKDITIEINDKISDEALFAILDYFEENINDIRKINNIGKKGKQNNFVISNGICKINNRLHNIYKDIKDNKHLLEQNWSVNEPYIKYNYNNLESDTIEQRPRLEKLKQLLSQNDSANTQAMNKKTIDKIEIEKAIDETLALKYQQDKLHEEHGPRIYMSIANQLFGEDDCIVFRNYNRQNKEESTNKYIKIFANDEIQLNITDMLLSNIDKLILEKKNTLSIPIILSGTIQFLTIKNDYKGNICFYHANNEIPIKEEIQNFIDGIIMLTQQLSNNHQKNFDYKLFVKDDLSKYNSTIKEKCKADFNNNKFINCMREGLLVKHDIIRDYVSKDINKIDERIKYEFIANLNEKLSSKEDRNMYYQTIVSNSKKRKDTIGDYIKNEVRYVY